MKMQNAEITFITFDAQDVIATSGGLVPDLFSYFKFTEFETSAPRAVSNIFGTKTVYHYDGYSYSLRIENFDEGSINNYYQLLDGHFTEENAIGVSVTDLGTGKPNVGTQITTWAALTDWIRGNSSYLR